MNLGHGPWSLNYMVMNQFQEHEVLKHAHYYFLAKSIIRIIAVQIKHIDIELIKNPKFNLLVPLHILVPLVPFQLTRLDHGRPYMATDEWNYEELKNMLSHVFGGKHKINIDGIVRKLHEDERSQFNFVISIDNYLTLLLQIV